MRRTSWRGCWSTWPPAPESAVLSPKRSRKRTWTGSRDAFYWPAVCPVTSHTKWQRLIRDIVRTNILSAVVRTMRDSLRNNGSILVAVAGQTVDALTNVFLQAKVALVLE